MNLFIHTSHHQSWQASKSEVRAMLGLPRDALPDGGHPLTKVQDIWIWIEPKNPAERSNEGKKYFHRVLANCPVCDRVIPVGRLQQHSKVHENEDQGN